MLRSGHRSTEAQREKAEAAITSQFQRVVRHDPKVQSAFLLVHADDIGMDLHLVEGGGDHAPAHPHQPHYMASVGKLFTATLIGMLHDQGSLSFDDEIARHLDPSVLGGLHVLDGTDRTAELRIAHLLGHTSGLADGFWPLFDVLREDPDRRLTPRDVVRWVKEETRPAFPPGRGFQYADTNYHLLAMIVEQATGRSFPDALRTFLFEPLGMKQSSMLHLSEPLEPYRHPIADFTIRGLRMNDRASYGALDHAGGGIVATAHDLLAFMLALTSYRLVGEKTLGRMLRDRAKYGFGMDYGYGIMQFKTVPLLMPKSLNCWGHPGATGAFMFFHPRTGAYLIGTFNEASYERKAVRFMMRAIQTLVRGRRPVKTMPDAIQVP